MTPLKTLAIALALLVPPVFLVSLGTEGDNATLWWAGLVLLAVGGLIPPATRFLFPEEDDEATDDEKGSEHDDGERGARADAPPRTEYPDLPPVRPDPIADRDAPDRTLPRRPPPAS